MSSNETRTERGEMLIDAILPEFDATIIEHLVIDARPDVVFEAAREMDFLQVHSPMLDALTLVRDLPATIRRRREDRPTPTTPPSIRLADLFDGSADPETVDGWFAPGDGWLALGEVPGKELVFGAIGKVWQPDIDWKPVSKEAFTDFAEPDYAKLAVAFSIRAYGSRRTLMSYEARTVGTDAAARRKFLRYWWLVRRFVHFVMRAALTTVKEQAEAGSTS